MKKQADFVGDVLMKAASNNLNLDKLRSEYEQSLSGNARDLTLFYLELRMFEKEHKDPSNLQVMNNYADFFMA